MWLKQFFSGINCCQDVIHHKNPEDPEVKTTHKEQFLNFFLKSGGIICLKNIKICKHSDNYLQLQYFLLIRNVKNILK